MENTHIEELETVIDAAIESETLSEEHEEQLRDLVEVARDATPGQRATVRTRFRQEYDRFFPAGNHTFEFFCENYYDPENQDTDLKNDVEFAISVAKDAMESLSLSDEDSFDDTDADTREEFVEQIKVEVCFAILVAINIVANLATEAPLTVQPRQQPAVATA